MCSSTSATRTSDTDGPALRQDVDQPFGRKPGQRLGDREAGDAEPLADQALVEDFAGAEGERDDGRAQHVGDMLGDAAPARERRALQENDRNRRPVSC